MPEIARIPIAVIVAHPDDETLWSGETILRHPVWDPFIVCICRASDSDRAPRFSEALAILKANGVMGDLDDGPDQKPLNEEELKRTILNLLPVKPFDLIITHNPAGEYTRHIRHEEVSKAVISLWYDGRIIRSKKPFFKSMPGKYLILATLSIVVITMMLPFTPLGTIFGFHSLSLATYLLLLMIVGCYIIVAEYTKTIFFKRVKF